MKAEDLLNFSFDLDSSITYEDLDQVLDNGEVLFDFLIENSLIINNKDLMLKILKTEKYLKKLDDKKSIMLLSNASDDVLFSKYNDDVSIIEYILANFSNLDRFISKVYDNLEIVDLCVKYKKDYNNISNKIINSLFVKNSQGYPIDKFSSDIHFVEKAIFDCNYLPDVFNYCMDNNKHELLAKVNDDLLLQKINNITLLELLLDNGITDIPSIANTDKNDIAEILFRKEKYELLAKVNISILVNFPNKENNYLKVLIEKIKEGNNIVFFNIPIYEIIWANGDDLAKMYVELYHNNLLDKMKRISTSVFVSSFSSSNHGEDLLKKIYRLDANVALKLLENNNIVSAILKKNNTVEEYFEKERIPENPTADDLKKISLDTLMKIRDDGKTNLDYYIEKNLLPSYCIDTYIENNVDLAREFQRKNYYVSKYKEYILFSKVNENENFLDILIENNKLEIVNSSLSDKVKLLEYYNKHNKFKIDKKTAEILMTRRNDGYLALKYLDNENFIKELVPELNANQALELYNISNNINMFKYSKEKILLLNINGKTVLDNLLANGIEPLFYSKPIFKTSNSFYKYEIKEIDTINILLNCGKIDLIVNANIDILMNYPDKFNNYFQMLIDSHNQDKKVHFEEMNLTPQNLETKARLYIQMYKNGLGGFLEILSKKDLLEGSDNNESFLSYLIKNDSEITLNQILRTDVLKDMDISIKLKELGIDSVLYDLHDEKYDYSSGYRNKCNSEYAASLVSPVEDELLELRDLFLKDGKSDKKAIETLITSYRYTSTVSEDSILELRQLIAIKRANMDKFVYVMVDDGSYFSTYAGTVCLDNYTISTIEHETGHAMHSYLADNDIPEELYDIIDNIGKNPEFLEKVDDYAIMFRKYEELLEKKAEILVEEHFDSVNDEKFVSDFLTLSKEKQMDIYLNKGYSKECLEEILGDMFRPEEFIKQKKKVEKNELVDTMFRYEFDAFTAIGDIIDGITKGFFKGGQLENSNNQKIPSTYGHGINYYKLFNRIFFEMIANYSEMKKSKNGDEALKLLRSIVGDELVDLIEEFYSKRIVHSDKYISMNSRSM